MEKNGKKTKICWKNLKKNGKIIILQKNSIFAVMKLLSLSEKNIKLVKINQKN